MKPGGLASSLKTQVKVGLAVLNLKYVGQDAGWKLGQELQLQS